MKAWRLLTAASGLILSLLLNGCLVTSREALPANQPAPTALLGEWVRKNEWGQQLFLDVSRAGADHYHAKSYLGSEEHPTDLKEYNFSVTHHGSRWYASVELPASLGGHYAIGGFELTDEGELALYNLDIDRIRQAVEQSALQGEVVPGEKADGVLVTSPLVQLFGYLDDPANSDVFVDVAHYQRIAP